MKLIRVLAPTAPSGKAYFNSHGVASLATIWSTEAQADDDIISGSVVTLDSSGYGQCYVDEEVDVTVETAAGITVQTYSVGDGDSSVICESVSFDGELADGSTGAGGRITLREILDLIYTSFGAKNFLVRRVGATADQHLHDALSSIESATSPFYNVMDYGAKGDGVTNDQPAIQAAIAAAIAAGGGIVYFPATTTQYMIYSGISVASNLVSLLGTGSGSCIEYINDSGSAITITGTGTAAYSPFVKGLYVTAHAASIGSAITISGAPGITLENFRCDGFEKPLVCSCRCNVIGGSYTQEYVAAGADMHGMTITGAQSLILGAEIVMDTADALNVSGVYCGAEGIRVIGCSFDMSTVTNPTGGMVLTNFDGCVVAFNRVKGVALTALPRIKMSGDKRIYDVANSGWQSAGDPGDDPTLDVTPSTADNDLQVLRESRSGSVDLQTLTATTGPSLTTYLRDDHKTNYLNITAGAANTGLVLTASNVTTRSAGEELIVFVKNSTASDKLITYTADFERNGTTDTVAAGKTLRLIFVQKADNATADYFTLSAQND